MLRFAALVDKQCGAGFSLRGTSVPLERRAGTCGTRAEDPPQAEARTTFWNTVMDTGRRNQERSLARSQRAGPVKNLPSRYEGDRITPESAFAN